MSQTKQMRYDTMMISSLAMKSFSYGSCSFMYNYWRQLLKLLQGQVEKNNYDNMYLQKLFGLNAYRYLQIQMQFEVKAGKFQYDKETKKVKAIKDKGNIKIYRNQEYETHFTWINEGTKQIEFDMIVFPGDAIFEKVVDRKNTFVLRFGMDEDRYFFWLQEKKDEETVVAEINKIINAQIQEEDNEMVDQKDEKPKIDQQPKPEQTNQPKIPLNISDMIKNLSQNLQKGPDQNQAITHLFDVFNSEVIKKVLQSLTQQEKEELLEFMPEQQKDLQHFASNVRSPQFLQSLDALSDALNSENSFPLFAQMRLDNTYLNNYYGVEAFLRALIAKAGSKKPKQEEK